MVTDRERAGLTRKEAISDVARELGRPKREVYAAVVRSGDADSDASAGPGA
jgi:16S rRNA (cytidine1402-2'-O)-methyltransferase